MLSPLINTAKQDTVHLGVIRLDGGTQPRAGINDDYVDELVAAIQAGVTLPPIDVIYDGEIYWLFDGFHRVAAHRKADYRLVPANIHQGTQADAQWRSYAANQTHGLRRNNEDKQRAIIAALRHPNGVQMPDREIARHLGVDHKTVGNWREKLQSSGEIPQMTERTVTRDGVQYTQNTTSIGANQRPRRHLDQLRADLEKPQIYKNERTAPSPYKSLAQMDADGEIPPLTPRPSQPEAYAAVYHIQNTASQMDQAWCQPTPVDTRLDPWAAAWARQRYDRLQDRCQRLAVAMTDWGRAWTDDKGRSWVDVVDRNPQHANSPFRQAAEAECKRRGLSVVEEGMAETIRRLFGFLTTDDPLEPAPDDRIGQARRLIAGYQATIFTFDEYGELIGAYLETLPAKRELEKLIQHLEREINLVVEEAWA